MERIKFYSEEDVFYGVELNKAIKKIEGYNSKQKFDINDILDFHNILKYTKSTKSNEYIIQNSNTNIQEYKINIKSKIGEFIGIYKDVYLNLYDESLFSSINDFLEVMERYKIFSNISKQAFNEFIVTNKIPMYIILKFKGIVKKFDLIIKEQLLLKPKNIEVIFRKYINNTTLYLPDKLTKIEIYELLDKYINGEDTNINFLKDVINFPNIQGIAIPDKTKLNAIKRVKTKEKEIFTKGSYLETNIRVSYTKDQEEVIVSDIDNTKLDLKISFKWIEENLDYPTLWNNFIYVFDIVDYTMRLTLDSKKTDINGFESLTLSKQNYLYPDSISFNFKEMMSNAKVISYCKVLNILEIQIEEMIEWFFNKYLNKEFDINNFIVKMPGNELSFFEKCRIILPEIDRIFKQYEMLVTEGAIDQELIQISSSSIKIDCIKSFNNNKYVYSSSELFNKASHLLFSSQSNIIYMHKEERAYQDFVQVIRSKKRKKHDFEKYQLSEIEWLIDNNIVYETEDRFIKFVDEKVIYILKDLYENEVINYWHYPNNLKELIEELNCKNLVTFESSLFSTNEQDYFSYYLNKSKFTNGHDIRNQYLHGTNTNDEAQSERDYYTIIKLFIIIVIKINDDLCINNDINRS